jgi:16S rRNA (cytidine1402-2'-O)-methyltransferase
VNGEDPAVGSVILAATPLGNPGDASARLVNALATADVIAAEDTRRTGRLIADLQIPTHGRLESFYDAVERERTEDLIRRALAGETILVVSDAGMPTISDPGYRLVVRAIEEGVPISVLPGPSAVLTALALSGLAVDRFCFEGFLPRKAGERSKRVRELATESRTMVFFEAPHRLSAMLRALGQALGDHRRAAVCRELTKTYEEVKRGTLGELVVWSEPGVRGEITVVVAGADVSEQRAAAGLDTPESWVAAVQAREHAGEERRAAIAAVAKDAGIARREVYDAVVKAKSTAPSRGVSEASPGAAVL